MRAILAIAGISILILGVLLYRACAPTTKFGTFIGAPKIEVQDLVDHPRDHLGKTWAIDGTIRRQCETMGCYFYFGVGTHWLRVDLANVAMHAPSRNGHEAHVEGELVPYNDEFQFWASAVEFK